MINMMECYNRINQPIPTKEILEEHSDYECTKCLRWMKVSDFGIKSTGRIYRQCIRCRIKITAGNTKRKLNKEKQNEHISGNIGDEDKMNEGK